GSSSETTTDLVNLTNNVLNPAAGNTNSLLNLSYTNASTNSSGTSTIAGITLTPTQNVTSGAGTLNTIALNLGTLTNTACSAGSCNKYAIYAPSSNNWGDLFNYNGTSLIDATGHLNAAQLTGLVTAAHGGTGIDTSGSSGVPSINSGTWQTNAITQNG